MASSKIAWGIEVGADAIKAIRLERSGDDVSVTDFAVIPHKKVLTTPDLDQDEMIRLGLGQFISQKALESERLVMSVPGHAAFARFAKLPPVEPKKVPDIVKFEAVQQIPFPIDQVEWDYQTFASPDSPEVEVGIFAITRERVNQRLSLYGELGIQPDVLTLSPVAVYNAMAYDLRLATAHGEAGGSTKPMVFMDIGTSATDIIIADQGRCWIRTFPLGGTHFTDAVTEAFKLTYSKADKLKQESATSKYAKQIMQAMRPVFSDLLQEVQRSLGYYQSLHRETKLETIVGIGSTYKIPGLRKFLGQQLQMDVLRLDEFKRIRVEGRDAAEFAAHTVSLATAYGLALQGVGLGAISVNLAPVGSLREQMWRSKTKWFAAAAALAVVASGAMFIRPWLDSASMRPGGVDPQVEDTIRRAKSLKEQHAQLEAQSSVGFVAENMRRLVDYRSVWPRLVEDAVASLRAADPQPELVGDDPDAVAKIPAPLRQLVSLNRLDGTYNGNADNKRLVSVVMEVEFSHDRRQNFLNDTVAKWLREKAHENRPDVPYRILDSKEFPISINTKDMSTTKVAEDGKLGAGSAGGAGHAPGDGGSGAPGQPRRGGGTEVAPPSGGELGGGGGGGGGANMGGFKPNRPRSSEQLAAPGSGLSIGGGPTGGAAGNPAGSAPTETGGTTISAPVNPAAPEPKLGDIDKVAPIPSRPKLYKAGDEVHRAIITFTIELPPAPGAAPNAAGAAQPPSTPA
ncbi:MAG: type IV pilus assembly protein PilM [Phycisphaerales bacterium]